jgi:hypothetical protein
MPCFEHNRKWQSFESRSKLAQHSLAANQNKTAVSSQQTRSVSEKARDLVHEFNLRELKVCLVKLSDKQVEKLTQKQSSDKFINSEKHSLASQDVSDVETDQNITQLATSSEGKHKYLFTSIYVYSVWY